MRVMSRPFSEIACGKGGGEGGEEVRSGRRAHARQHTARHGRRRKRGATHGKRDDEVEIEVERVVDVRNEGVDVALRALVEGQQRELRVGAAVRLKDLAEKRRVAARHAGGRRHEDIRTTGEERLYELDPNASAAAAGD